MISISPTATTTRFLIFCIHAIHSSREIYDLLKPLLGEALTLEMSKIRGTFIGGYLRPINCDFNSSSLFTVLAVVVVMGGMSTISINLQCIGRQQPIARFPVQICPHRVWVSIIKWMNLLNNQAQAHNTQHTPAKLPSTCSSVGGWLWWRRLIFVISILHSRRLNCHEKLPSPTLSLSLRYNKFVSWPLTDWRRICLYSIHSLSYWPASSSVQLCKCAIN